MEVIYGTVILSEAKNPNAASDHYTVEGFNQRPVRTKL
jgi:hypothetical protein